jgi:hypothetical protein
MTVEKDQRRCGFELSAFPTLGLAPSHPLFFLRLGESPFLRKVSSICLEPIDHVSASVANALFQFWDRRERRPMPPQAQQMVGVCY